MDSRAESRRLNFIRERFGLDKRRSGIQPVFSTDVCSAGNPWWRCAYHGLPADIPPGMKACALMPGYQCQRAGDEICTSFPPGSLRSRFADKLRSIEQPKKEGRSPLGERPEPDVILPPGKLGRGIHHWLRVPITAQYNHQVGYHR